MFIQWGIFSLNHLGIQCSFVQSPGKVAPLLTPPPKWVELLFIRIKDQLFPIVKNEAMQLFFKNVTTLYQAMGMELC